MTMTLNEFLNNIAKRRMKFQKEKRPAKIVNPLPIDYENPLNYLR